MPRSLRISTRRIGLIWASTLRGSTQPEKRSSPASTLRQTLVSPITFKRTSRNIANLKAYQACVDGNTRTIKRRAFRETPRVQRLVLHENGSSRTDGDRFAFYVSITVSRFSAVNTDRSLLL